MYLVFEVGTVSFISRFPIVPCFALFVNLNCLELTGNGSLKVTKVLIYPKDGTCYMLKGKSPTVLEFYII